MHGGVLRPIYDVRQCRYYTCFCGVAVTASLSVEGEKFMMELCRFYEFYASYANYQNYQLKLASN